MARYRKAQGFTIVEVLVALTIFSMIMLATLTAMRTFGDSQSRIEKHADRLDQMRQVTGLLRSVIGKAIPVPVLIRERGLSTYFTGSHRDLVWVAPMATGAGNGGVYFFRLTHEQNKLLLQRAPFITTREPPDWGQVAGFTLVDSVDGLELGYRHKLDPDEPWRNSWELSSASPKLVRINLRVKDRYWPEMVIRLDNGKLQTW